MQYGYFDDEHREYVITRPDTPKPWVNYLGSPEYGAIISNNAGGYSFVRSGANGRILRYIFNQGDEPGRYIYLRDNADGDYWSVSWQPVGKDVSSFESECRHGMGYTTISSKYRDIRSEALYYVPLGASHEVWMLRVKNEGAEERSLTVTGYAEFTNNPNYEQDQINLQFSLFTSRTVYEDSRIRQILFGNLDTLEDGSMVDEKVVIERFFGLAGAPVSSYCGSRENFLGAYRSCHDPAGVASGDLGNTLNYNENSCGALASVIKLAPGEEKTMVFLLGEKDDAESRELLQAYHDPASICAKEKKELVRHWDGLLSGLHVETPSPEFNSMINTWHAYNCFMTFIWSRAASFIYCGLRNGYGYRDTVQDIQGVIHLAPEMAREKLCFMLSAQVHHGGGLPLVKFTHDPGHEDTPEDDSYVKETGHPSYRADDALWLFPTVWKYVSETGETAFLDEVIPFADQGEGTVYEHLLRALKFSAAHSGPDGLPAGLYADWNDCLRLGENGESTFVALQFYLALSIMNRFAKDRHDAGTAAWIRSELLPLKETINRLCWDDDRFIRGITESGLRIGAKDASEADLWLNPQTWSVISGLADEEQVRSAMELVHERLNTAYGAVLMDPPFHKTGFPGALARIYNPGSKENAGIFLQPQGWLILAEALLGHGDRAYEYYCESSPAMQNDRAEVRGIEPYSYGQFTEGPESPFFGRSQVHWLTGTASTVMVGVVEGILGIRPSPEGIKIEPSIPKDWPALEIRKMFRGKQLDITILNPSRRENGYSSLTVNGHALPDNFIPAEVLEKTNKIILVM